MSLRYEEIAEIMKIIDSSACDEVIVETGDVKLVVRRGGVSAPATVPAAPIASSSSPSVVSSKPVVATPAATASMATTKSGKEVVAPMTGTFYRAPSPDKPPFVEVGSIVRAGQPLCVIEVMKLFTTINAECDGRIVQIAAENSELVEFGHVLFVIEAT